MESPKPAKFADSAPISEYCSDMLMLIIQGFAPGANCHKELFVFSIR